MRSKLFKEQPKTLKTSAERWVGILPDEGAGYGLSDRQTAQALGRLLFDRADNWIYDGEVLSVVEQEEIAGFITGFHKEMDELVRTIK
jgi:hypothetical protein